MNTRRQFETAVIRGFSGKPAEGTEIHSGAISPRNATARRGRILADAEPAGRAVVLNWLLGDLSQMLDAEDTASTATGAYVQ